jgi:uncharacterized protein YkwD
MNCRLIILLFTILFPLVLKSQGIYDSLNLADFRKYEPFNTKIDVKDFNAEILNAAVFFATNEIRKKHKLPQLKYNASLGVAATMHSTDMAKGNFFNHTNYKNKKHKEPEDRAILAGIDNPHIAENIIEGFLLAYTSGDVVISGDPGIFYKDENYIPIPSRTYLELADELLRQWMDSDGHRTNILAKDAVELGCGSALFHMKDFNEMPCVKCTQNFQWFVPVISKQ